MASGREDAPQHQAPARKPGPEAELVSVNGTMALLGIGRTKLYELLNDNTLDSVKIGRRTLVRRTSLRRLTEISDRP
ncbi:MAG: helix-turn-helix domain-containing protein [Rhodospirillum sp.]|nr:helix-turn-helix domain-containing protein [Rhodospirillum sp.]MCF8491707.1 helix-turn-helix domain-containing protein [Rhodospirillum sp.]